MIKLFAHADDTTRIFVEVDSLGHVIEIYNQYGKISGAKLNRKKCIIMPVKNCGKDDFVNTGFAVEDAVKVCGVFIGERALEKNEESLNKKIDEALGQYQNRRLTLHTRATIVNNVILHSYGMSRR